MDFENQIKILLDKEAIRELLYRYARSVDREDWEALKTIFWPDAIDDHGSFRGSRDAFIEWASKLSRAGQVDRLVHKIGSILIEFIGENNAAVESYFTSYHRRRNQEGGMFDEMLVGRYVDHIERRGDRWGIAHRTVVRDWVRPFAGTNDWAEVGNAADQNLNAAKPDDAIYRLIERLQKARGPRLSQEIGSVAA